jgi:nucleoside-diphosphate-sugar epimerase
VTRFLITGASGFIGRHLLGELMADHRIFGVARGRAEPAGAPLHPNIEWLQADLSSRQTVLALSERIRAAGGVDVVVHLAGYYDFTGRDAPEYQSTNVEGLRNLLEVSRKLRPRRFVFASSVAACDFPPPHRAVVDDTPPEGRSPYARSKRLGEEMVRDAAGALPSCIVRFAALFSDWCEYEPLYVFLSEWLSPGWRSRVLAGQGRSAIPYMHIRDAVSFFSSLMARLDGLEPLETLTASTDGATSHRDLYTAATACHFGQRRSPILVPRPLCLVGLRGLDLLGLLIRRRPFERPWMGQCIDRALRVDASRARARLAWAPKERLDIVRRMPFLIHNRRTRPVEWLRRNHVAPRRIRLRTSTWIEALLSARQDAICRRLEDVLRNPVRSHRFPAYLDCTTEHLEERHRHLVEQLLCAIRTGDKGVFMATCRHLAERWRQDGLPPEELWGALECLDHVCLEAVRGLPEAEGLGQALHDHVSMTIQFGIDVAHEVSERQGLEHA